ncbi:MAG: hypothetical protein ACE5HD_09800 [Acidobacteriota bacterium]
MREKLVAHFKDGEIVKGYSGDFISGRDPFHLFSPEGPVASSRRIGVEEMKALFFVRTWGRPPGRALRVYRFGPDDGKEEPGRRAVIRFRDGEKIWGYVLGQQTAGKGFYLVPADPVGNNLKVFVVESSVEHIEYLERFPDPES